MGVGADVKPPETPEVIKTDSASKVCSKAKSDVNSESEDDTESDEEDESTTSKFVNCARPQNETLEEKKARKQAVREAKAEKRKNKMPKHMKKKRVKDGRGKN